MKKLFERFSRQKAGAALVEYVVLVGMIGVLSIGVVLSTGKSVRDIFGDSQASLASATDLGDTEVAEAPTPEGCYTVTSNTDFYDPAYTCYEIDSSLDIYPDYTSETSDPLTFTFTPPTSIPGTWGPWINVENGELTWDNSGPHGDAYIGHMDTVNYEPDPTGNVSITFPNLSCADLELDFDVYNMMDGSTEYQYYILVEGTSKLIFDESLDSFSCLDTSSGTPTTYDDPSNNYIADIITEYENDPGIVMPTYTIMDTQIYDGAGFNLLWSGPSAGNWPDLPVRVTWKLDSYGYVTDEGHAGEYCAYSIDDGYFISDYLCYPRATLEGGGMGEDVIDDVPYTEMWYDLY